MFFPQGNMQGDNGPARGDPAPRGRKGSVSGAGAAAPPKAHLIGAPDPAPTWIPAPAQFDTLRALIKATFGASSVSISFDGSDLIRTSGVQMGFMGVPLVRNGELIGALRVLDSAKRRFTNEERALLEGFAALVVDQFELWQQASRDPLTGAMSRRVFVNDLAKSVAACQRVGDPAALILFDLDHFKSINDTHGHVAGDVVLRTVAEAVAGQLRAYDSFGRLGGEEFAILLNTDLAEALEVAGRVRTAIASSVVPGHPEIAVTASFGVVACSDITPSANAMLDAADAQLYAAKQAGRNRVHWASRAEPSLGLVQGA